MNYKEKIVALKKEKNAVILAHYYVEREIQDLADYVGDSFFLAQKATELKEKNIIMVGVYFMGESIKILNPEKNVYMLDYKADCPMAHMVTLEDIQNKRDKYEDLAVVCYVNSTAEIKAHSDVCVTSSNALKIVENLEEENIFFIPDKNLGAYIRSQAKNKNIILHDGYCPVHDGVKKSALEKLIIYHPGAKVLIHPECPQELLERADFIGSTKGIIQEAGKEGKEFIIVTENGISHELEQSYPEKTFYYLEDFICPDMKMPKAEDLLTCLEKEENEVHVPKEIAKKAYTPLERMLKLGAR